MSKMLGFFPDISYNIKLSDVQYISKDKNSIKISMP